MIHCLVKIIIKNENFVLNSISCVQNILVYGLHALQNQKKNDMIKKKETKHFLSLKVCQSCTLASQETRFSKNCLLNEFNNFNSYNSIDTSTECVDYCAFDTGVFTVSP